MAAWSRKMLKKLRNFLRFLERRPLTGKFSKFCFDRIHCDTDRRVVFNFHEIWPAGNRWNRALLTWQKFRMAFQILLLRWTHSKPARASHRQCAQSAPDLIQIGSVHFQRSYIPTREHHQSALQSESNIRPKPSFEPNKKVSSPPHIDGSVVFTRWHRCALSSNTCFLGPTLVHISNSISIGSAVFAQLTAEGPYDLRRPLLKNALLHSGFWTHYGSLGPLESITQTAS